MNMTTDKQVRAINQRKMDIVIDKLNIQYEILNNQLESLQTVLMKSSEQQIEELIKDWALILKKITQNRLALVKAKECRMKGELYLEEI